jgi:hypothetical protein
MDEDSYTNVADFDFFVGSSLFVDEKLTAFCLAVHTVLTFS